jgi:hypothetical protein
MNKLWSACHISFVAVQFTGQSQHSGVCPYLNNGYKLRNMFYMDLKSSHYSSSLHRALNVVKEMFQIGPACKPVYYSGQQINSYVLPLVTKRHPGF